ncbi:MAG: gluconolactonase [Nocardioidaceae bacterium]|nr:gluconolactonase [Nocardioidaceae bacterium]
MTSDVREAPGLTAPMPTRFTRDSTAFATVNGDAWTERLFTGGRWLEGPTYFPAGRFLVFSDIPNDRLLRWDETSNVVSVFRSPANFANGHTRDRSGRLVSCEQGERRVVRTEHDGRVRVLADSYAGRRLNSPNDIVERSDGSLWFTDPSYGIDSDYEGHQAVPEQDGCFVYRLDPGTGELAVVADDFVRPNGLAFSADETTLYIADTRERHIRRFAVTDAGLSGGDVLCDCAEGSFDGLRIDDAGRIWAAAHDGVHCISPEGELLGRLLVPEVVSNLTFGGSQRNQLFITATSTLYSVRVNVTGIG